MIEGAELAVGRRHRLVVWLRTGHECRLADHVALLQYPDHLLATVGCEVAHRDAAMVDDEQPAQVRAGDVDDLAAGDVERSRERGDLVLLLGREAGEDRDARGAGVVGFARHAVSLPPQT